MDPTVWQVLKWIVIPVAGFAGFWGLIGIVLWRRPDLWDITSDESKQPLEEDMLWHVNSRSKSSAAPH